MGLVARCRCTCACSSHHDPGISTKGLSASQYRPLCEAHPTNHATPRIVHKRLQRSSAQDILCEEPPAIGRQQGKAPTPMLTLVLEFPRRPPPPPLPPDLFSAPASNPRSFLPLMLTPMPKMGKGEALETKGRVNRRRRGRTSAGQASHQHHVRTATGSK